MIISNLFLFHFSLARAQDHNQRFLSLSVVRDSFSKKPFSFFFPFMWSVYVWVCIFVQVFIMIIGLKLQFAAWVMISPASKQFPCLLFTHPHFLSLCLDLINICKGILFYQIKAPCASVNRNFKIITIFSPPASPTSVFTLHLYSTPSYNDFLHPFSRNTILLYTYIFFLLKYPIQKQQCVCVLRPYYT